MQLCPMVNTGCRFCSKERTMQIRQFTDLKTSRVHREIFYVELGEFCNNDGKHFVKDMKECPARIAVTAPMKPFQLTELSWMSRRLAGSA